MVQDAIDELTVRGKSRIIPVVDMIAPDLIPSLISALAAPACLVIPAVRQKFVPDAAILGDPHPNILMLWHAYCLSLAGFIRILWVTLRWLLNPQSDDCCKEESRCLPVHNILHINWGSRWGGR